MTVERGKREHSRLTREQLENRLRESDLSTIEREKALSELTERIKDELIGLAQNEGEVIPQKGVKTTGGVDVTSSLQMPQSIAEKPKVAKPIAIQGVNPQGKVNTPTFSKTSTPSKGVSKATVWGILIVLGGIFLIFVFLSNFSQSNSNGIQCRTIYGVCGLASPLPKNSSCFCYNLATGFNDPGIVE